MTWQLRCSDCGWDNGEHSVDCCFHSPVTVYVQGPMIRSAMTGGMVRAHADLCFGADDHTGPCPVHGVEAHACRYDDEVSVYGNGPGTARSGDLCIDCLEPKP